MEAEEGAVLRSVQARLDVADASKRVVLHVICDRDVGLFNLVLGVLSHVHWALSEGRIPIVFYGKNNCYWTPLGYRGRDTVWEYYFEPVIPEYPASRIPSHILEWIADNPRIKGVRGLFVDELAFVSRNNAWHIQHDGEFVRGPQTHEAPSRRLRKFTSTLVGDYIRPRDFIVEKADRFARETMAHRYVIGVHIRGTDAIGDPHRLVRQTGVNFRKYCSVLRRLLRKQPDALIFVASDAHDSVNRIRRAFGKRVIAYDSIRHEGGQIAAKGPLGGVMPAFLTQDRDRAARNGEDAVVEYLLLCRCNYLVHNLASIPRTVLLSVPEMPQTNIDAPSRLRLAVAALRRRVAAAMPSLAFWYRRVAIWIERRAKQ